MKIERALDIKTVAKRNLQDIIHSAIMFKTTSKSFNEQCVKMKNNLPKKTPLWVINYLEGYRDANIDFIYHKELEFCYKLDGKLYSIHRDSKRNYEKHGFTPQQCCNNQESSGHYWKDTDKPWFIGE